jgi:hypothetical protein
MAGTMLAYSVALDSVMAAARATAECSNACRKEEADSSRILGDTSDLCFLTATMMMRGSHYMALMVRTVADALESTARHCRCHGNAHNQRCATVCHLAADECRHLLVELPLEGMSSGQRGANYMSV